MPIEIKELHIKVKIEEEKNASEPHTAIIQMQSESLKSEIIKACTAKVLEKLKEKQER